MLVSAVNIIGGFVVSQRMLNLFKHLGRWQFGPGNLSRNQCSFSERHRFKLEAELRLRKEGEKDYSPMMLLPGLVFLGVSLTMPELLKVFESRRV